MKEEANAVANGKSLQLDDYDRTLGVEELNLAEFPICSLSTRTEPGQNTLIFEDEVTDKSTGKRVKRSLVIAGSEHFGLPTAVEADVLLVLIHLSNVRTGLKERKVSFSRYEIIKFLSWDQGGKSYERLDQSLRRWTSVTMHYRHAWWDRSGKKWRSRSFHVLESLELRGKDEFSDDGLSSFVWNDVIFSSFQAGNLKRINLDVYFRLQSAIAKQIYRFADKRFYLRKVLEFKLRDFACEHIGLSRSHDNYDLKRKLQPALAELEAIGFLKRLPDKVRFAKRSPGNWEIRLERAGDASTKQEVHSPQVAELTRRGVSASIARRLSVSFPPGYIADKIALHDQLLASSDRRIGKNPPGFLAAAIRDNYKTPISPRTTSLPRTTKRYHLNERPESTSLDAERATRLTHFRKHWSQLSQSEQAELETQAVANSNSFQVTSYQRLKASGNCLWEALRDELVATYLADLSSPS